MLPVLLIDDNPDDALLVRRAFVRHRLEHPLVVMERAEAALDWLRAGGIPTFILLDLHLPGISGVDFLQRIRLDTILRDLRVVAFTSDVDPATMAEVWATGVSSILRKPLDGERFMNLIVQACHYWTRVNVPPRISESGQ